MKMKSALAFTFLLFSIFAISQNYADLNWQFVPNLEFIGDANFITHDFDDDGVDELFYSTFDDGVGSLLKILDHSDDAFSESYVAPFIPEEVKWIEMYDLDSNGVSSIYILHDDQEILVFDMESLSITDTIELDNEADKFFFVNIDEDPGHEMVTISRLERFVYVYDDSGEVLANRDLDYFLDSDFGDVDGDGMPEVVISGSTSYVFNATDLSEEWASNEHFGDYIDLQDIDGSGKELIYGVRSNGLIRCFDAVSQSVVFGFNGASSPKVMQVMDIGEDGIYEILTGNYSVYCYDINSTDLNWSTSTNGPGGITGFALADLDGDGLEEIALGNGQTTTAGDHLVIFEPSTLEFDFKSIYFEKGFIFDIEDIDQNGILDYFIGGRGSDGDPEGGVGFIVHGDTKEYLMTPQVPYDNRDLVDVSMFSMNNSRYLLYLYNYRIMIFDYVTGNLLVDEFSTSQKWTRGGFEQIADDSYGLVMCDDDGLIRVFEFTGEDLNTLWSAPETNFEIFDYLVGNFDDDLSFELATLDDDRLVRVYDLESYEQEKEFQLSDATDGFTIADVTGDGIPEVLYFQVYNTLGMLDYQTEELSFQPIQASKLKAIKCDNLDNDNALETVILSDRLLIFDDNWELLFESKILTPNFNPGSIDNLEITDVNTDDYKEILVATNFGVFEFLRSGIASDIILPEVVSVLPPDGTELVAPYTSLEVQFSELPDTTSFESNVLITNSADEALDFSTSFDTVNFIMTISPVTAWPLGEQITVTLKNDIVDLDGNPLDGNGNGAADGEEDDYSWSFATGTGADESGPAVKGLTFQEYVFKGTLLNLSGYVTDSSEIAVSTIAYLEYFLDETVIPGSGIPIVPEDFEFDQITESFRLTLPTLSLDEELHTLSFIARDHIGNWGPISEVTFEFVEESDKNWTQFGHDNLNTSANLNSDFSIPFKLKYTLTGVNGESFHEMAKCVVVENFMIYPENHYLGFHQLVCRNIETQEVIWTRDFSEYDDVFPVTFAYGYLYTLYDYRLACLDINNGETLWDIPLQSGLLGTKGPIVKDEKVYVVKGNNQTNIAAYDAFSGELIWENMISFDYPRDWIPAIHEDTLYAYTGALSALNIQTGETIFSEEIVEFPYNEDAFNPVVDTLNNQVILSSTFNLIAYDLEDHSINWSVEQTIWETYLAAPTLVGDKLYMFTWKFIREYDAGTGELLWEYQYSWAWTGDFYPVANQDFVLFSKANNTYIFDRANRELVAQIPVSGYLVLGNDYLIIGAQPTGQGVTYVFENDPDQMPLAGSLEIIDSLSCYGDSNGAILADVSGGGDDFDYTYEWNIENPETDTTLIDLETGVYSLTVTDYQLNTLELEIELASPEELVSSYEQIPEVDENMNGSASVTIEGGTAPYTYSWSHDELLEGSMAENLSAGNYTVTITDANECELIVDIVVDHITNTYEVEGMEINIYPSITISNVNVESESQLRDVSIIVLSAAGQKVFMESFDIWSGSEINLSGYPAGVYNVILKSEEGLIIEKIIKQ
ncbi:MAG: T9SS C-terminal target domain-containing protein [Bacteroidetes bacterium]|nr:MAG: T9SS C-terminal target domain-containing protein [Bacteroidota bacterium]